MDQQTPLPYYRAKRFGGVFRVTADGEFIPYSFETQKQAQTWADYLNDARRLGLEAGRLENIDPFHVLTEEMNAWLNQQIITGSNIGKIRRMCFVPWESKWNTIVRLETAERERGPVDPAGVETTAEPPHTEASNLENLSDWAWSIIASVSGGNWDKQSESWKRSAQQWREAYHGAKMLNDVLRKFQAENQPATPEPPICASAPAPAFPVKELYDCLTALAEAIVAGSTAHEKVNIAKTLGAFGCAAREKGML